MEFKEIIIAALTGGVFVTLINKVYDWFAYKRERDDAREDEAALNTEQRLQNVEDKTDSIIEGMKFLLYDRIRHLGEKYIAAGEIDFDDRRILNCMHEVYHNGFNGNGDLDILMKEVNRLPLKQKGDTE